MAVLVSNQGSDAAQKVADSLNQGSMTGWDLLAALVVIVLSIPVARLVAVGIKRAFRRASITSDEFTVDITRAAKWLVYLIASAIAAGIIGVHVGFLSVLFVFALIIGALALKPMIENSASGVVLLARPAFSVGDQIKSTEFRGVVEEIGSRSTRLRQSDGVVVFVSNNQVLGNPIVVYSARDSRKGNFDITVAPDTDLDHLTSMLMTAITSVDDVVADPAPAVQATALTENALTLNIGFWFPSTNQSGSTATDGVIRATTAALRGAGIELTVPAARLIEEPAPGDDPGASNSSDDTPDNGAASENDR